MLYDYSKTPEALRVREAARAGYDAFLDAVDEYTRVEWVDGEAEYMSPISAIHLRVGQFLLFLIYEYLKVKPIGEVFGDGFQMKINSRSGRVPDLFFLRNEHLDRVRPTYLNGAADLVVEIVSPDSVKRDREQKFAAGGVEEYWIVDTVRGVSEFYILKDGTYSPAQLSEAGYYESPQLPGLRIHPKWLNATPLPTVRSVLAEAVVP